MKNKLIFPVELDRNFQALQYVQYVIGSSKLGPINFKKGAYGKYKCPLFPNISFKLKWNEFKGKEGYQILFQKVDGSYAFSQFLEDDQGHSVDSLKGFYADYVKVKFRRPPIAEEELTYERETLEEAVGRNMFGIQPKKRIASSSERYRRIKKYYEQCDENQLLFTPNKDWTKLNFGSTEFDVKHANCQSLDRAYECYAPALLRGVLHGVMKKNALLIKKELEEQEVDVDELDREAMDVNRHGRR